MATRRKRALYAFVAVLAMGLVARLVVHLRARSAATALTAEVEAAKHASFPRKTHAGSSVPGTFASHVDPLRARVEAARDDFDTLSDADKKVIADAIKGSRPANDLPPAVGAFLDRQRDTATQVLRATAAEAAGPAWAVAPFGTRADLLGTSGFLALARVALLDARVKRETGVQMLPVCFDVQGLARDLRIGARLVGLLTSLVVEAWAFPLCMIALDEGGPQDREVARDVFRTMRDAVPKTSAYVRSDALETQRRVFGSLLDEDQNRRVPALDDALVTSDGWERFVLELGWPTYRDAVDSAARALDEPKETRAKAVEKVRADLARSWSPGVELFADAVTEWAKLAEQRDRAVQCLDALATRSAGGQSTVQCAVEE